MIERCAPGTVTGSPACAEASAQAASSGSSPISRGVSARPGAEVARGRGGQRADADRHDDEVDGRPSSCASSSAKIVP